MAKLHTGAIGGDAKESAHSHARFQISLVSRPGCNFHPGGALYSCMRILRSRLTPLPLPLRWVLALALILNGGFVPPVVAHAAMAEGHGATVHAMSAHCHHHNAPPSSESAKHRDDNCPCCSNGAACHCGCVVALALPRTFPDLRPVAPLTLTDQLRVPDLAAVPLHRLLRPPIV